MKILSHLVGLAAAGVVLGAANAGAQGIQFKGTTEACFLSVHVNAPDCNTTSSFAFDQTVAFLGGSFNQYTTNSNPGTLSIGDGVHPGSNFGLLNLYALPSEYTDDIFKLAISFEDPTYVTPEAVFTATMFGQVDRRGDGGVYIDFGDAQTFNFNGPSYSGMFTLELNDVALAPSGLLDPYSAITGNITTSITGGPVTATPEPGTTALLATGFVGLIPLVRRRVKKAQAA